MTSASSPAALTPDLCVIGAGSAGLAAAAAARALDLAVVLIDRSDLAEPLPRAGDVVRRYLIAEAECVQRRTDAGAGRLDWHLLRAGARAAAAAIAPDFAAERFRSLGVVVLRGTARFRDPRTVEVGPTLIRARRVLIATGAERTLPSVPGIERVPVLTPESVLDKPALPSHLLILGDDPLALVHAQIFRRLGSAVSVFTSGAALGTLEDELRAPVLAALRREGVRIHEEAGLEEADLAGAGVCLRVRLPGESASQRIEGSHLMAAEPARPALTALNLAAARIRTHDGRLYLSRSGRTTNRRVYAAGDVTGATSVQAATSQVGVVLRAALFRLPAAYDPRIVVRLIETDPAVATVGLDERQALDRGGQIRVLRWPFGESERGRAERRRDGHVKVVLGRGRVLGAAVVGRDAAEQIALWTLAVAEGFRIGAVARLGLPVPSYADVSRKAAVTGVLADLANPWVRRLLRVVHRLG